MSKSVPSKTAESAVIMPDGYSILPSPFIEDDKCSDLSSEKARPRTNSRFSKRTIMILGATYNTNNYGVRVLLSGAVQNVVQTLPGVRVRVLDYQYYPAVWDEPTDSGAQMVALLNLRFSWKLQLPNNIFRLVFWAFVARAIPHRGLRERWLGCNPWIKQILDADLHFSLAGGDSFSDIYGLVRLLYVGFPQILVLLLGRRLRLLPQTYGPFQSKTARIVARAILRNAESIYSRDSKGVDIVESLIGKMRTIKVVPDVGFSMSPEPLTADLLAQVNNIRAGKPLIGLNISKLLYMGGYSGANMFGLKENHVEFIGKLIDAILARTEANIILVPHVFGEHGESEVVLCRNIYPALSLRHPGRIGFIDRPFNHRQIKSLIGQCDVFSGGRMHACIAAVSQCVPTVSLAYSDKFAGVMAVIDSPGAGVADLRQADASDVFSAISRTLSSRNEFRQHLKERIPQVKRSILLAFREDILRGANEEKQPKYSCAA